jgi:hypothetical protein
MKNLTSAYEALTGQVPNDAQIQELYKIKQLLGIRDNDALWDVMIALQYHRHLYGEVPEAIQNMASKLIESLRDTSATVNQDFKDTCIAEIDKAITFIQEAAKRLEAEVRRNLSESQLDFTKKIRDDALSVMKNVSEKDRLRWFSIALATCGVASLVFSGVGFWLGSMKGYNDAVEINTKYHWSNTEDGKLAFQLYEGGNIRMLATCSGEGWKEKGNNCFPHAGEKNQAGYQMRR